MTRVAQLAQQQLTLNNVRATQERLQDAQIQVSTGQKSRSYAGIFKDATRLVSLEASQARIKQFVSNNTIISDRLERMDSSISNIFDALTELRKTLIQATSDSSSGAVHLTEIADNLLSTVTGQLNAKENGRFLFAGSMTTTQPVTVPVPDPTTFGVPEANYYNGDQTALTARVDEATTITYGMTGDRAGFQDAISALKAAIQAGTTGDRGLMETALARTNSALQTIAGYRAEIGSDLQTIDRANSNNNDFLTFIEGSITDIESVDIPETVARMSADQTVLQASFLTLARITNLSLLNFLR